MEATKPRPARRAVAKKPVHAPVSSEPAPIQHDLPPPVASHEPISHDHFTATTIDNDVADPNPVASTASSEVASDHNETQIVHDRTASSAPKIHSEDLVLQENSQVVVAAPTTDIYEHLAEVENVVPRLYPEVGVVASAPEVEPTMDETLSVYTNEQEACQEALAVEICKVFPTLYNGQ